MTKDNKPTMVDRMNYTDAIETSDLMTKEERSKFEQMTPQEQNKFMEEVILPRATSNQP